MDQRPLQFTVTSQFIKNPDSLYISVITLYVSFIILIICEDDRNNIYCFRSISGTIIKMRRTFPRITRTRVKRKSISCFVNFVKSFRVCAWIPSVCSGCVPWKSWLQESRRDRTSHSGLLCESFYSVCD